MLFSHNYKKVVFGILIFVALVFTRFVNLDWGRGNYFHPDENNMASSISQMKFEDLNPRFFAYGQFPLYLSFFSAQIINFLKTGNFLNQVSFPVAIISLRIWSAVFSVLSILIFYKSSKFLFKTKVDQLLFIGLLTFSPGLIQISHFGTTESILIFVFAVNILLSFYIFKNLSFKYVILAALVSGIGLGTKISAIILTGPIFLSLLFLIILKKQFIKVFLSLMFFIIVTALIALVSSPYNLIEYRDFISSMEYEVSVATGEIKVFYTNQFLNSKPYIFQITHIFPYVAGFFISIFSIFGLYYLYKLFISSNKNKIYWLLVLIPTLVYFLYNGQLYTKWTRFMSPIFFVFPLLATLFMSQFKNNIIKTILLLISILPGIFFINLYLKPDIRIEASNWVTENISPHTTVLSESGNVINFPVSPTTINVINFDFYQLDSNNNFQTKLPQVINDSKYIFIPSRRVYKNQNNSNFPYSKNYYENLFSGVLGFKLTKQFTPSVDLFLNGENAEETWSVFDHPIIRIYEKNKVLQYKDYQDLIYGNKYL